MPAIPPLLLTACLCVTATHLALAQRSGGPTDKAADVISQARAALGGDAAIGAVKTFTATGRTRQIRGDNLVPIEFEIQVELPDKYSRRDEFPAQDAGPQTSGFNGDRLIQIPAPPPPPARGGAPAPSPEQQQAAIRQRVSVVQQDFVRLMLGMFAGSSPAFPVAFAYVGQAQAPQGTADVLDVKGAGSFAGRLFIDGTTHLPVLLTWQAPTPPGRRGGPPPPGAAAIPPNPPVAVEQRMFFADYRGVDGLQLPFRIRRAVGAETTEETTFDRFRINAKTDPRRFDVQ